jgi:opacity protein-like surface antigen
MRKSLLASAVVAGLGIASASQAAIVVTYIDRGTPIGSGGAPVATGYKGYTVRLTEDTGANITAIDMESGTNGFFAQMVQRWTSSGGDGNYDTSTINLNSNNENLTNSVLNFDSHLLQPGTPKADANYVGKIGFAEDLGGATFVPPPGGLAPFPANNDNTGITLTTNQGSIQAAFGINGPVQSPTFDLMYVVLPEAYAFNPERQLPGGALGFGTVLVATAGGAPQQVIFPAIPEPGTIALAGLSALGLLARRRRD